VPLAPGTHLGHYEILSPLGSGGMGEVYRARDHNLDRDVAVKVLPEHISAEADALQRFDREVRAIATLNDPRILTIHDYGDHAGRRYAVTELLEGETLADRIARQPISWREALDIALEVARGLATAHGKGVIHRDIKPSNIFITSTGAVKILDFGLACSVDPLDVPPIEPGRTLPLKTEPGAILGTVGYMSPEQARGEPVSPPTDIFSLGCVVYEMLSGRRPFQRATAADTLAAILNASPPPLVEKCPDCPPALASIVERCLNKSIDQRFARGADLAAAFAALKSEVTPPDFRPAAVRRRINRPRIAAIVIAVLAVFAFGLGRTAYVRSKSVWARENVLPEIERLSNEGQFIAALRLAEEARLYIPEDAKLGELIAAAQHSVTVLSEPRGAEVAYRAYEEPEAEWISLGKTPLQNVLVPRGLLRWRLELEGHETVLAAPPSTLPPSFLNPLQFVLEPVGERPEGMVYVPSGQFVVPLTGFNVLQPQILPGFHIDRYEVTNEDFQDFVDAGGYASAEFWNHRFEADGQTLTWEEALGRFVDQTGRPGPATWELGRFPEGRGLDPVSGVSWFEAAAYAEFRGRKLPTLFHWSRAALSPIEAITPVGHKVIPLSNFGQEGLRPAGDFDAMSPSGAINMGGNVREWCLNEGGDGRRFILGGSWADPPYMLTMPATASPFDRSPYNGFRLASYLDSISPHYLAAVSRHWVESGIQPPLSADAFEVLAQQLQAPPKALDIRFVGRDEESEAWVKETVSIATGYDDARLPIMLYLPRSTPPPWQAVIFYPGADALFSTSSSEIESGVTFGTVDFIPRSGRVLVFPILWGTYERGVTRQIGEPGFFEHSFADITRTLDYLETREDINASSLAYYGFSMGAVLGGFVVPFEPRFKAAILVSGGLSDFSTRGGRPTGLSRILPWLKIPVLTMSGRYDYLFPHEASQKPFIELIGAPPEDKRAVTFEAGHWPLPRHEVIKETVAWLDKYLGTVPSSRIEVSEAPGP
jgi:eukaryotic-like serine/threonine-protein kinase